MLDGLAKTSIPLIREYGNGAWFMLSMAFALMLGHFAYTAWVDRQNWTTGPWAFLAALTLCFWSIASGIRAGGMWWIALTGQSPNILAALVIYGVATVMGIISLAGCIAVFRGWRVWLTASAACLIVPAIVHVVHRQFL